MIFKILLFNGFSIILNCGFLLSLCTIKYEEFTQPAPPPLDPSYSSIQQPALAPPMMPVVDMWAWVKDTIESLKREIEELRERVDELEDWNATHDAVIEELKHELSELKE